MNACAPGICLLGLLFAFTAVAAPDEPSALGESYKSPAPKKLRFPLQTQLESSRREGWVMVNMMVSPQGTPYAVAVVESSDSIFEKSAIDAVNGTRFTAGSVNGVPVDSAYALKFIYSNNVDGASTQFIRQFKKLEQSIKVDDKATADEALQELKFQNLYEEAFYHLGRFLYFRHWGSEQEQLEALQNAIAYEKQSKYLPSKYFQFALAEIFRLQVKTQDFGGALETYEAFESKVKKDPGIVSTVEKIKDFSTNGPAYLVRGEIPKTHSWNFRLMRRNFTFLVSQGKIEEIKLRCQANYVLVRFKPDFEYTVPPNYGACSMEVVGDSGTTFALVQS